jgi:hypothetical protein
MIIHFTSSYEYLENILSSNSLKLFYSKEDFVVGKMKVSQAAHPMVCFSEYDKKELENKVITYGKYAIAFSVDWARNKKISPVIYVNKYSMAAKGIGTLLRARQNQKASGLSDKFRLPIMQLKSYLKNEQGYNSYFKTENFNFKTENEWRFVPEKNEIGNGLISQHKSRYLKNPDYYNNKLEKYPLKFRKTNIINIFVANEKELESIKVKYPELVEKVEISKWK